MTAQTIPPSAAQQTSAKKIVGMIEGVAKTYTSAHALVQEAAIALISHAKDYNDCSLAKRLVWAIPARDRNLFISWLGHFSPIGVKLEKTELATKVGFMKPENKILRARDEAGRPHWDIEGAKVTPWTDDVTGQNPVEKPLNTLIDFRDTIDKMLKREIANAMKEGEGAKYSEEDRELVRQQATKARILLQQLWAVSPSSAVPVEEAAATGNELPVGIAA